MPVAGPALPVADLARTIVASGTHVHCRLPDRELRAPYADQGGAPVLRLHAADAPLLAASSLLCLRIGRTDGLGWVVLSGRLVDAGEGRRRLHVETVLVAPAGHQGAPISLSTEAYLAASPHEVLARGWMFAHHLTCCHGEELLGIAAGVRGVRRELVAAAEVRALDPLGLDLRVVDLTGSWDYRIPFRTACETWADVAEEMTYLRHRFVVAS